MSFPGEEINEDCLILLFNEGDEFAFKEIYKLYGQRLYSFAFAMTSNHLLSEDVVTETFVKAWQKREHFDELRNLKAFLFTVARNSCLDYIKHIGRRRLAQTEILYLSDHKTSDTETKVICADLLNKIFHQAQSLPVTAKKIFFMTFAEGLNPAEIAQILQMPIQNVHNNKNRAVDILRVIMKKNKIM